MKIVDAQEVEQTIKFISKLLEIMRIHSEVYDIELKFKGFLNSLCQYETKLNDLNLQFNEAFMKDSFELYAEINEKLLGKNLDDLN